MQHASSVVINSPNRDCIMDSRVKPQIVQRLAHGARMPDCCNLFAESPVPATEPVQLAAGKHIQCCIQRARLIGYHAHWYNCYIQPSALSAEITSVTSTSQCCCTTCTGSH